MDRKAAKKDTGWYKIKPEWKRWVPPRKKYKPRKHPGEDTYFAIDF